MAKDRRHKAVTISGNLLDQFLCMAPRSTMIDGAVMCTGITSTAPNDLHVIGLISHDLVRDTWNFLCESTEFGVVPEGTVVPSYTPMFTTHWGEHVPSN